MVRIRYNAEKYKGTTFYFKRIVGSINEGKVKITSSKELAKINIISPTKKQGFKRAKIRLTNYLLLKKFRSQK